MAPRTLTFPFRSSQGALLLLAVAAAAVAEAHGGHATAGVHRATAEELAAFEIARPVFERHCFRCHTTDGHKSKSKALDHLSMDRYPFGGHHADEAGTVVSKVLRADAPGKATMPSDDRGAVRGDDLAKVLAWAAAFDRARNAKGDDPPQVAGPSRAR